MALKPTIYKATVNLSDIDRHYYDELQLTLAQHPSETVERMMVRLLAYCLQAGADTEAELSFTKGLSTSEEPDLWCRSLDNQILHWIEVGQPEPERLKKGANQARQVSVYAFGKSAATWWQLNREAISALPKVTVYQFDWADIQALSQLVTRTMALMVSITENTLYISAGEQTLEVPLTHLSG